MPPSRRTRRRRAAVPARESRLRAKGRALTAAGNPAVPSVRATAGLRALEGVRERDEAGHAAAGRTAPPHQVVDDAIRDIMGPPVTEDEKLFRYGTPKSAEFTHTDTWRLLRIMGEFIEGFEERTAEGRPARRRP